eukprot:gnl/TRDRNA2_/TRDRNA2_38994_c0_seq1.p1 gnl/TRDRNA2_/TRDRNA2_38994_c0~~gnl/TRDRNA2_/TRDRNA2_38994_c0_seq1.p1  ORF type:complete len:313 (-),score=41.64 gnl/TRDRNA2_/TRDRNA2_38994_c0_seq1:227-1165(-)
MRSASLIVPLAFIVRAHEGKLTEQLEARAVAKGAATNLKALCRRPCVHLMRDLDGCLVAKQTHIHRAPPLLAADLDNTTLGQAAPLFGGHRLPVRRDRHVQAAGESDSRILPGLSWFDSPTRRRRSQLGRTDEAWNETADQPEIDPGFNAAFQDRLDRARRTHSSELAERWFQDRTPLTPEEPVRWTPQQRVSAWWLALENWQRTLFKIVNLVVAIATFNQVMAIATGRASFSFPGSSPSDNRKEPRRQPSAVSQQSYYPPPPEPVTQMRVRQPGPPHQPAAPQRRPQVAMDMRGQQVTVVGPFMHYRVREG